MYMLTGEHPVEQFSALYYYALLLLFRPQNNSRPLDKCSTDFSVYPVAQEGRRIKCLVGFKKKVSQKELVPNDKELTDEK